MMREYPPTEGYTPQNLDAIFARAVEGPDLHDAIEVAAADASVVLASANVGVNTAVSFAKEFAAAPVVVAWLVDAPTIGAYVTVVASAPTTTGYTLKAASGAAQTVKVRWLAFGRRM